VEDILEPAPVKVPVYDNEGKLLEELEAPDALRVPGEPAVVHDAVRGVLAGRRRGTSDTKTRAEVRGGGRKPWRQKGTGRARTGSIRSPHWTGGGTIFGPQPKDWSIRVPRKVRRLALRQALSSRIADGQLLVLRDLGIREGKSREARTLLEALEVEGNALLVVKNGEADSQPLTERAFRNLRGVRVVRAEDLNAYDVLWGNRLLFTEKAFDHVKGAL